MEFLIKRCSKCGATVKILKDCTCPSCGIECCGEKMEMVKPNSVEASTEKHIPTYEVSNDKILVTVNHVMEEDHYIEWIAIVGKSFEKVEYFKPGDEPKTHCKYEPGSKIYAWCNKHLLWVKDVD